MPESAVGSERSHSASRSFEQEQAVMHDIENQENTAADVEKFDEVPLTIGQRIPQYCQCKLVIGLNV